jgi:hypothetical protein
MASRVAGYATTPFGRLQSPKNSPVRPRTKDFFVWKILFYHTFIRIYFCPVTALLDVQRRVRQKSWRRNRIGRHEMPVTQDNPAPYAPSSVILNLLARHRDRGLPTPVTSDVLSRAGVTDSLNARTLHALQVLDLIDDDGNPTPMFESLRLAPEAEYKARMSAWLNAAYADALKFVDPATATDTEVHDAFRSYRPPGMRDRMVTLFLGLFEAAGIAPERKRKAPQRSVTASAAPRASKPARPAPSAAPQKSFQSSHRLDRHNGFPPALSGLLSSLPPDGDGWTKQERDRFVHTFEAVLDFCYPVTPVAKQKVVTTQEEDDG